MNGNYLTQLKSAARAIKSDVLSAPIDTIIKVEALETLAQLERLLEYQVLIDVGLKSHAAKDDFSR